MIEHAAKTQLSCQSKGNLRVCVFVSLNKSTEKGTTGQTENLCTSITMLSCCVGFNSTGLFSPLSVVCCCLLLLLLVYASVATSHSNSNKIFGFSACEKQIREVAPHNFSDVRRIVIACRCQK